jgi:hypothetical protein
VPSVTVRRCDGQSRLHRLKEMESLKNQTGILELKNTITEMKKLNRPA